MGFDPGGIHHQHLFRLHTSFCLCTSLWRCVGFCLSAGGAGQPGDDHLDNALLPPEPGRCPPRHSWGGPWQPCSPEPSPWSCRVHGRLGHPRERRPERSTWMMPLNTLRLSPRDLGKNGWILSSCSPLGRNRPSIFPSPERLLGISPSPERGAVHPLMVPEPGRCPQGIRGVARGSHAHLNVLLTLSVIRLALACEAVLAPGGDMVATIVIPCIVQGMTPAPPAAPART